MAVTVLEGDLSASVAEQLASVELVACDTETGGLDWRSDALALCQVHAPGVGTYLIRCGDRRPERLAALLSSPAVTKVFHHAPFDLRFLRRVWDVRVASVVCTKIASKLLQPSATPAAHSLAPLVRAHLGVTLDKGPVRVSDWSAAELSDEQIAYAARDVEFLVPLLSRLTTELDRAGLADTFVRCCEFLPTQVDLTIRGVDDVFAY